MIFVREAKEQDFPFVTALIKNELGYPDLDEAEVYNRLKLFNDDDNWITLVAVDNDEIIGFIGVMKGVTYSIEGYYSQIMALAVSNNYRRSGVGTMLIRSAEEWSTSNEITSIGVNCNLKRIESHAFYEKNGYIKRSYSFYKNLQDHY